MQIIMKPVSELTPYAKNAKKHDTKQIANVANSIKRFGWQQPIVIDDNGVVVIGHCRLLAAKKLGQKEVPVTIASGLTEEEIKALRLADNKTNESEWDFGLLEAELADLSLDFDMSDFGFDDAIQEAEEQENKYTTETKIPQYTPNEDAPDVDELIAVGKMEALLAEIEAAGVSEQEKEFLRIAAYRHAVINFDKVADYYANASSEMQILMEHSALVLIDLDDAIANGFTTLTAALDDMMAVDLDE